MIISAEERPGRRVCVSDFLMEHWSPGARLDLNLVPSVLLAVGLYPPCTLVSCLQMGL